MPDPFDDFLAELKRRQAGSGGPGRSDAGNDPPPDDIDDETGSGRRPTAGSPGGGEPPRRPRPIPIRSSGGRRFRAPLVALVVVLAVVLFLSVGVGFWTDVLWYRSVGFESVLWTRVGAAGGLFVLGFVVALVALLGNLLIASRLAPPVDPGAAASLGDFFDRLNRAASFPAAGGRYGPGPRPVTIDGDALPDLGPIAWYVIGGFSVLAALVIGGGIGAGWETVLLWIHRVPFAATGAPVTDPVFGQDISWFLFTLPFLRFVQSIFNNLVLLSLLVAGVRYLVGIPRSGLRLPTPMRVHLAILGGLFLLSVAVGYQLDKYELVYSTRGFAVGVSYTDAHAQFLAFDVMTVLSALAAALLIGLVFTRRTRLLGATIATWLIASFLIGTVYPEIVQRFTVAPNQLAEESPYIANNIAMTRLAYDLTNWDPPTNYDGEATLTQAQITADAATFQNARLWDYRPLGATIDQLQTVRQYYKFVDVDTDRYIINGQTRQVMLSARELDLAANPTAVGWVNQRIIYTHGIGLVMVPVNEVTPEGQPVLFVKDLPPASADGAPTVTEPRIYFGEKPTGYVVVGAKQPEFDYPQGGSDATASVKTTVWSGSTGIPLDTTFARLLFAIRFGDLDLLISDQVTPSSQLLMYRDLGTRLQLLAPFLKYDKDPYVVVDGQGHLDYIQDAFTTSDAFPNAQPFDPTTLNASGLGTDPIDYIRNSVKVVMNAYDGSMRFYVADPNDPIIRDYEAIFPDLFRPLSDLQADLAPHLRVPEELFNVQTQMYGRYHVQDVQTFFRTDDQWTVPAPATSEQSLPSEAYYVVMRIPGEANPEFLLLQPMVPKDRPNMIAWVAARNDAPNYGTVRVFRFPTNTTVLGPAQIEARIDQDPTISAQITLWNASGSKVIRGNLIVVPVGDSLVYLQPVYLQSTSTSSTFPEFERIVVASPTTVVWGRTLSEALNLLLAGNGQPTPTTTPQPTTGPGATATPLPSAEPGLPTDVPGLIAYANDHYALAQQALRDGDLARYGQEIALVGKAIAQLELLAGATPNPSP